MNEGLNNKTEEVKKGEELIANKNLLAGYNSIHNATTKDLKNSLGGYRLALSRLIKEAEKWRLQDKDIYKDSMEKIEENILRIEGELLNRKEMTSQKFSSKDLENIDDILEWEKIHDEE